MKKVAVNRAGLDRLLSMFWAMKSAGGPFAVMCSGLCAQCGHCRDTAREIGLWRRWFPAILAKTVEKMRIWWFFCGSPWASMGSVCCGNGRYLKPGCNGSRICGGRSRRCDRTGFGTLLPGGRPVFIPAHPFGGDRNTPGPTQRFRRAVRQPWCLPGAACPTPTPIAIFTVAQLWAAWGPNARKWTRSITIWCLR